MRKPQVLLATVFACALLAPGVSAPIAGAATSVVSLDSSLKIHPLLQYGAQTDPTTVVRVIVQATSRSALVAARLNGTLSGEGFMVIPGVPAGLLKGLLQLFAPAQQSVSSGSTGSVNWTKLLTTYPFDTGAQSAWAGTASPVSTGAGVAVCLLYTSPSPRDRQKSRMPSSA